MKDYRLEVTNKINKTYGENAVYILRDCDVESEISCMERFAKEGDVKMAEFCFEMTLEKAERFNNNRLTPVTVKVGEGVTVHLWSDSEACTVIKKTRTTITVQRDKATLDPNFKPQWIEGGFVGHCINQEEQTYTYETDSNGSIEVYRWSNKYNSYRGGGDQSVRVSKGRHEFYDYNF